MQVISVNNIFFFRNFLTLNLNTSRRNNLKTFSFRTFGHWSDNIQGSIGTLIIKKSFSPKMKYKTAITYIMCKLKFFFFTSVLSASLSVNKYFLNLLFLLNVLLLHGGWSANNRWRVWKRLIIYWWTCEKQLTDTKKPEPLSTLGDGWIWLPHRRYLISLDTSPQADFVDNGPSYVLIVVLICPYMTMVLFMS